jgi:Ku protein
MAPRPYWKGYLKLSLVSCPVALYAASTQAEKTHFHQINTRTGHRLRQQMVDESTGRVVDTEHKGRGYELSKGKYVAIDDQELAAVEIESTHTIDIDSFVPKEEIDERYIEKPYYIVPNGEAGEEAYAVIRDAMRDKNKVALARIVMAHREHVIAIQPFGNGLLGTVLRYPYEVRETKDYFGEIKKRKMPKDMVSLAAHILETKAGHFDGRKFKDEYETALKKLIRRKAKGKPIEPPAEKEEPSNVINLMDALRQSLGKRAAAKRNTRRPKAKRSTRRARKAA